MASRHAVISAFVLGSVVWCGSASAVVIDSFTDTHAAQEVQTLDSPSDSFATNQLASTISNQRTVNYDYLTEADPADSITLGVDTTTGRMIYNATPGANGSLGTTYNDTAGVSHFNFASEAGFRLEFQPLADALPILIALSDLEDNGSIYTATLPAGATSVDVPFAAFTGTADLASLDRMFFELNPASGGNFELDSISTYIPEPSSLALLGVGAFALLRRREAPSVD